MNLMKGSGPPQEGRPRNGEIFDARAMELVAWGRRMYWASMGVKEPEGGGAPDTNEESRALQSSG